LEFRRGEDHETEPGLVVRVGGGKRLQLCARALGDVGIDQRAQQLVERARGLGGAGAGRRSSE